MNALVPFRLADEPFDALADPQEMAAFMRNSLPGQIDGLKQVLLLASMDKAKVIAFLEGRGAEDGTDAMTDLFEQVQETSEWIAGVAQIASSVAARVMVALHQIADIPGEEPSEDDLARQRWDEALAAHDRERARFEALGDDFTDEAINEVAADYSPVRDTLIGTPAPDLPALLRKFEIMWRPEDGMRGNPDEMDIGEFHKDLRRLAVAA